MVTASRHRWLLAVVVLFGVAAASRAATVFIEGEAIYLERILPPPQSTLIVSLQDSTRADAPAVERASSSSQIGSGPPYAWRLAYDDTLGDPQRLTLRASIVTPAGLWMSTDTVVSATGAAPLRLRLRRVAFAAPPVGGSAPAPVDACAGLATQADMNRCAQEDFEAASAGYAERYRDLSKTLPAAQRDRLRRMQSAWLKFRTEACRYESGPSNGGSVESFVYWRCVSRMTRERSVDLQARAACSEGDIACTRRAP